MEWPGASGEAENADNSRDKEGVGRRIGIFHFENLRGFNAQSERFLTNKLYWESRAILQSLSVLDDNSDEVASQSASAYAGKWYFQ